MSEDPEGLEITGGAGGLGATYEDMLTFAGVVDGTADAAGETTTHLLRQGAAHAGDLVEAALLVPEHVAATETRHAEAIAATGLLQAELEVTARLVRAAVWAYRATDAALAEMQERALTTAGFGTGLTVLPILTAGGLTLLAAAGRDPRLAAMLLSEEGRAALATDLDATIYASPWLQDALTRAAPGFVQGSAVSLFGLPGTLALSGGDWPTADYHEALTGLLAAAGLAGQLGDRGEFGISGRSSTLLAPGAFSRENFVADVFRQQRELSRDARDAAVVQVVRVPQPDETSAWIVSIPGTQEMGTFAHEDNPLDMDTNVNLMQRQASGSLTEMEEQVIAAMHQAGIGPDEPVMLTGHSQGGITAASLATRQPEGFSITSVVTGGSPIARFDVPGEVSVLSLEHSQDIIPKVDAAENPDLPQWTTVTRDLPGSGESSLSAAHDTAAYAETGALVDASTDASVADWREHNAVFFAERPLPPAQRYEITRSDR